MAATDVTTDPLAIAGTELRSRLLLGTGGFRSLDALAAAIEASGAELVTVALRRIDPGQPGSIVDVLDAAGVVHDRQAVAGQRAVGEDVEQRVRVRAQNSATPSSGVDACA